LLATGESRAAATLALALEGAGVPTRLLEPAEAGLVAQGPSLAAVPVALDPEPFDVARVRGETVVLPGFNARDAAGEMVLLGRGGTDLTALFVAARLGAECRLLKDTGGVFEADPKRRAGARRFESLSWEAARRLGGRVVQDRALELAQSHGHGFTVAALGRAEGTRVGSHPTRLASSSPSSSVACAEAVLAGAGDAPVAASADRGPGNPEGQPALAMSPTAATSRATSSGVV
jgi:homoserine dehydrogenase